MTRLAWLLRRHRASFALWTGIGLIVGTLALHGWAVKPLEAQVEALQARRAGSRDSQLDRLGNELERSQSASEQLASFYGYFAREERITARLARVYDIAQSLGLEMKRADYKMNSAPERKLDRYQMIVPMQGSYPVVRSFITTLLRELPTMSIDQVQFQRKDIGVDELDAQISLTFYLTK